MDWLTNRLAAAEAQCDRLRQALEGLLDGLDANGDQDLCGLTQEEWDERCATARAALGAL